MVKIKMMIGDKMYSEFDIEDGTPTSTNMAMTMITQSGQTLMMEWEQYDEKGNEKFYALTYAFTVKPEHLSSLGNLIDKGNEHQAEPGASG